MSFAPAISVVTMFFEPPKEPVLARLNREAIQAILAESEALIANGELLRAEVEEAFKPIATPLEFPSTGFIAKRQVAEAQAGCHFVKFFTE